MMVVALIRQQRMQSVAVLVLRQLEALHVLPELQDLYATHIRRFKDRKVNSNQSKEVFEICWKGVVKL